jgi:hypothetical protein
VLTVKNGAASCASVQVYNPATGETVLWANTLAADAWLRFTSATQRCDLSVDSGVNWTKRNDNVTGVICQLQGGVENAVVLTGPTTGTHEYEFTAKG